jgi:hypothetical protein
MKRELTLFGDRRIILDIPEQNIVDTVAYLCQQIDLVTHFLINNHRDWKKW